MWEEFDFEREFWVSDNFCVEDCVSNSNFYTTFWKWRLLFDQKPPCLIFQSSKSKSHLCKSRKIHNHTTNWYQVVPFVCILPTFQAFQLEVTIQAKHTLDLIFHQWPMHQTTELALLILALLDTGTWPINSSDQKYQTFPMRSLCTCMTHDKRHRHQNWHKLFWKRTAY